MAKRHHCGQFISNLLKDKGMSISALARKSGVSKNTLVGWISQDKTPSLHHLKNVASALGISLHKVAFGCPDPFENSSEDIIKELFSSDVRIVISRVEAKSYAS